MITLRKATEKNWSSIWHLLEPVFRAGETYAFNPEMTEQDARQVWLSQPLRTYIAEDRDKRVIGTYYLKPNQQGPGAHVCNCGYIVSTSARGRGVASAMCDHSQQEAMALGFQAIQFNSVVSTNETAVHLWQKHGFEIVGTLPKAFNHPDHGMVDTFVMYKTLGT